MNIQSVVLLFLRKPNCDSGGKISVLSAHSVSLFFIENLPRTIQQCNPPIVCRIIGGPDLWIGHMMPVDHEDGYSLVFNSLHATGRYIGYMNNS